MLESLSLDGVTAYVEKRWGPGASSAVGALIVAAIVTGCLGVIVGFITVLVKAAQWSFDATAKAFPQWTLPAMQGRDAILLLLAIVITVLASRWLLKRIETVHGHHRVTEKYISEALDPHIQDLERRLKIFEDRHTDEQLRQIVSDRIQQQMNQVTPAHGAAVKALVDEKTERAYERLKWYSPMRFGTLQPVVTIRSVSYGGDYDLVKQIEKIITENLRWSVELDGKNEPMLPQANKFKVIFESGLTHSFDRIASTFSEGNLLGVPIGQVITDDLEPHKLVIKVLPSAP